VENFAEMYVTLVHQMMSLTAAMSLPLALLRRTGTLAQHNARFEVESTRMLRDLEPLRGLKPGEASFERALFAYLERHGHRGAFESDIASPRIQEDPLSWVLPLLSFPPLARPELTWMGWLTLPLAWWAAPLVRSREWLRSQAMRAFARVRGRVLALSAEVGLEPHQVWLLSADEWLDWQPGQAGPEFWAQRERRRQELEELELPPLLRSFEELKHHRASSSTRLQGMPLTSGKVVGRAWVCRHPDDLPSFEGPYVLVSRAVDPGWLPAFARAAAVLVEIGGDLSHGSILLRELGIPAITNLEGLWGWAEAGDWLEVDAESGMVAKCQAGSPSSFLGST
jgi:pyruvate,water dikinase